VLARIGKIEVGTEATGIGDVIGNKGGVALALKVDDLSLCFISSHLVHCYSAQCYTLHVRSSMNCSCCQLIGRAST
jgi:hypothetical protein